MQNAYERNKYVNWFILIVSWSIFTIAYAQFFVYTIRSWRGASWDARTDFVLLLMFFVGIWIKMLLEPKRDGSELMLVAFAMAAAYDLIAGKPVVRLAQADWRTILGI